MPAPTVHLLSSATFDDEPILDVISASIDESGSPQEYVSADSANVKLVAVDRIAATVTVTKAGFEADPAIGTAATAEVGLHLVLKPRAEGKGVTTDAFVTIP